MFVIRGEKNILTKLLQIISLNYKISVFISKMMFIIVTYTKIFFNFILNYNFKNIL